VFSASAGQVLAVPHWRRVLRRRRRGGVFAEVEEKDACQFGCCTRLGSIHLEFANLLATQERHSVFPNTGLVSVGIRVLGPTNCSVRTKAHGNNTEDEQVANRREHPVPVCVERLGGSAMEMEWSSRWKESRKLRWLSEREHSKPGTDTMVAAKRMAGVLRGVQLNLSVERADAVQMELVSGVLYKQIRHRGSIEAP
jgi:hypothetical protein